MWHWCPCHHARSTSSCCTHCTPNSNFHHHLALGLATPSTFSTTVASAKYPATSSLPHQLTNFPYNRISYLLNKDCCIHLCARLLCVFTLISITGPAMLLENDQAAVVYWDSVLQNMDIAPPSSSLPFTAPCPPCSKLKHFNTAKHITRCEAV